MAEKRSTGIKADNVGRTACPKCGSIVDASKVPAFATVKCPQCGAQFATPGKFGQFVLLKELGCGQMGVTYKAFEKALGRYVAIKVMHESIGKDPKRVKGFLAEGRALASLDHPNAVRIFSLGQEKRQPYIVMELVNGRSMGRSFGPDRPMDEAGALQIATGVAMALRAAGKIGLVHSDVKPDNIVLDEKNRAKLVDFGIARFGGGKVEADAAVGTPYYVAPEQVTRSPVDHRTDIYGLGATLFHALAGVPPFPGTVLKEVLNARLEKPAPNLMSLRQGLHLETAGAVARMLEKDPARRYQNYDDLLKDLQKACRAAGAELPPEIEPARIPVTAPAEGFSLARMNKGVLVALVLGIAGLVGLGVWAALFRGGDATPANKVATPVFWPKGREISRSIEVTISCATSDAEIHYTTRGHKPNRMSPQFTGPIKVTPGTTLRVRAFGEGLEPSEVAMAVYGCDSSILVDVVKVRTDAQAAWEEVKGYDPGQGFRSKLDAGRNLHAQAGGQFDRDAYPAAGASYRKLLVLCRQLKMMEAARALAVPARTDVQSALKSIRGFGTVDRPRGPWKQVAGAIAGARSSFEGGDFAKARDLWSRAAAEINKRRPTKIPGDDIARHQGNVLAWLGSGPFVQAGFDGAGLFNEAFGPERGDKNVKWKRLTKGVNASGVDLTVAIGGADNCAAYLRTSVWSPADQSVRLEMGSDDALKVWVNGKKVHGVNVARGMKPMQDTVNVKLRKGWNDLMLKVIDYQGDWSCCCRIRKPDGRAITELKIYAE